ncbi:MAG: hypothetical protein NXH95_20990 [Pseudomonadaceae bacterium]|nr:hypothetical protein [Pseudomonadaceae bacterium]
MKRTIRAALAICLVTLLAACGGGEHADREAEMEAQASRLGIDADVTLDDSGEVESVQVNSQFGAVGQNLKLPGDFPADIPIDANWNIMSVAQVPPSGHMVQAMADGNVDALVTKLRGKFTEQGWQEGSFNQPVATMTTLGFEKGSRMVNVNITDSGAAQLSVQVLAMQKLN